MTGPWPEYRWCFSLSLSLLLISCTDILFLVLLLFSSRTHHCFLFCQIQQRGILVVMYVCIEVWTNPAANNDYFIKQWKMSISILEAKMTSSDFLVASLEHSQCWSWAASAYMKWCCHWLIGIDCKSILVYWLYWRCVFQRLVCEVRRRCRSGFSEAGAAGDRHPACTEAGGEFKNWRRN